MSPWFLWVAEKDASTPVVVRHQRRVAPEPGIFSVRHSTGNPFTISRLVLVSLFEAPIQPLGER